MLSKREKLFAAVSDLHGLICPVCRQLLSRQGDNLICAGGHAINVNRRGCVNLLSAQADTFYDAALFAARERVFAAGCYQPVADAIDALLPDAPQKLLDAGCGEGWYLNALLTRRTDSIGAGIDISRDAILQATNQPCQAVWCVGDLRRLPFADGTFSAVLVVLTPANYDEFRRVLSPDGVLLKVYPGQDYLREIRAARGMSAYEEGQVDAYLREKAQLVKAVRVHETLPVSPELWGDFVRMTPLNHDLSAAEKDALAQRADAHVTVDLHVALCKFR